MQKSRNSVDRVLDEALEMTFPASDPVAVVAPGSMSPEAHAPEEQDGATHERDAATERAPAKTQARQPAKPGKR